MEVREAQSSRRWSTEDVDRRRALAYWVDMIGDRFIELDIDTPARDEFHAHLEQVDLGVATANFLQADCQQIRRTRVKIARSRQRAFVLLHLRAGEACLSQFGREAHVRPGECVLMDGGEPYEIECPQATLALALRLPDEWLKRWLSDPTSVAARVFSDGGWSSALNAALASLDVESCDQLALPRGTVSEQIAALLALAVGRGFETTRQSTLLAKLMGTMRDRLQEPQLAPFDIAVVHGISTRSLHYAFAAARTTFSKELMRLRLLQACEMLSNPRFSNITVMEIAMRCGFNESSHLARRFRQHYGQAPARFRSCVALHRK